jgi:GT2 family glycosyltransferase
VKTNIIAIVVTYNRRQLLEICIDRLEKQSFSIDKILIVDNASTDDTEHWASQKKIANKSIDYVNVGANTGGAGGFHLGLEIANRLGYQWSWIMDDDAIPQYDALEELLKIAVDNSNIYGSIAFNENSTSWLTTLESKESNYSTTALEEIPDSAKVSFLPFLGLLISNNIIKKIGLPEKEYFIAADDVEYCLRAKKSGADIIVSGKSKIFHPKAEIYSLNLFMKKFYFLKIPPWKRYYDTRNRLLIARKHYGFSLFTKTLPGSMLRIFITFIYEDKKLLQLYASIAGIIDGILNIRGKRHTWWKIPQ